jgi:hypothetical protein
MRNMIGFKTAVVCYGDYIRGQALVDEEFH